MDEGEPERVQGLAGEIPAERRQLQLLYRKAGQSQAEVRVVDPYHLANINGEWFLFAYDHLRKDIRTFVPARIQALLPPLVEAPILSIRKRPSRIYRLSDYVDDGIASLAQAQALKFAVV